MNKIEQLLAKGYFPSQLPPPFQTLLLAKNYKNILTEWRALSPISPICQAEVFSVARSGHSRRLTALPNPISQSFLCADISVHWTTLNRHYKKSKLSVTQPKFDARFNRAVSVPSMHDLYERKILMSAGYKFMLRTDISRFFPTIYTHSIPWALHTKPLAKKNKSNYTPAYFGNILDRAVRQGQSQQTIGLPIGPDTSHIIAEAIAATIDAEIKKTLKRWPSGFRYVDDYYLFFNTHAEADEALSSISRALGQFGLQINFEKTQIAAVETIAEDFWTHQLRNCEISTQGKKQKSDIHYFFDFASELGRKNSDENVMKYALKRISSVIITKANWESFEAHICRIALASPNTLQTISGILATYSHYGYPLNKERLSRVLNRSIEDHAALGHHSEVAWSLWMCRELGLAIGSKALSAVSEIKSSICALILLDWEANSGIKKTIRKITWRQYANSDALKEDLWLLAYEGGIKKWLQSSDTYVTTDPYFKSLSSRGISFYNCKAKSGLLFTLKADVIAALGLAKEDDLFNRDEDLSTYLEFEDGDVGYDGVIATTDEDIENLFNDLFAG